MFKTEVIGIDQINAMMARLGRSFSDQEQTRAIKKGLKVVEQRMISGVNSHRKSGDLGRSIHIEKDRNLSRTGAPVIRVGRRLKKFDYRGQGWAAHLLESGTKAHVIKSKTGKMLPIISKGTLVGFAKEINHPGSRAFHTFSNAIDSSQGQALQIVEHEFLKIIDKEVAK